MSAHALLALADGRPIVSSEWLEESGHGGQPQDPAAYLLRCAFSERRYKFTMPASLERATRRRLLEGETGRAGLGGVGRARMGARDALGQ